MAVKATQIGQNALLNYNTAEFFTLSHGSDSNIIDALLFGGEKQINSATMKPFDGECSKVFHCEATQTQIIPNLLKEFEVPGT